MCLCVNLFNFKNTLFSLLKKKWNVSNYLVSQCTLILKPSEQSRLIVSICVSGCMCTQMHVGASEMPDVLVKCLPQLYPTLFSEIVSQ